MKCQAHNNSRIKKTKVLVIAKGNTKNDEGANNNNGLIKHREGIGYRSSWWQQQTKESQSENYIAKAKKEWYATILRFIRDDQYTKQTMCHRLCAIMIWVHSLLPISMRLYLDYITKKWMGTTIRTITASCLEWLTLVFLVRLKTTIVYARWWIYSMECYWKL